MCGRVTQFSRWGELIRAVGATPPSCPPRYNISPGTPLTALRREQGELSVGPLDWGFVPAWAAADDRLEGHVNARAEGIFERPVFREAARLRRCVVAVDGYYEWKTEGRLRVPFYFRAADSGPLALAGLWSLRAEADGSHRRTLCLVTTAPNREAAEIHGRMPVLLSPDRLAEWISERPFSPDDFEDFAASARSRSLRLHRVSPEVNRVTTDDAHLVAPLAGAADQGDFFGDLLG